MRRYIIAVTIVTFAVIAPAQQALQCVNPDVLNSLVFNARAEARLSISRDMPANPAGYRAPSGFALIGSGTRGPEFPSTMVAYKTTMAGDRALESLVAFLAADGWSRESTPQGPLPVLASAASQPKGALLCRNGERRNVQVKEIEGVRYATISGFTAVPARACGVAAPQPGFSGNPMSMMESAGRLMPQLSFPDTARNVRQQDGGIEVGSNGMSSSLRIQSPDPARTLARHLGRQLQEQGWRGDTEWQGKLSTGSTWRRGGEAGQPYWLTLEIISVGGGTYEVSYSLATRQQ